MMSWIFSLWPLVDLDQSGFDVNDRKMSPYDVIERFLPYHWSITTSQPMTSVKEACPNVTNGTLDAL